MLSLKEAETEERSGRVRLGVGRGVGGGGGGLVREGERATRGGRVTHTCVVSSWRPLTISHDIPLAL